MRIIKQILDDDYGCEERADDAPEMVILVLVDDCGNISYVRTEEKSLSEKELGVGSEWIET